MDENEKDKRSAQGAGELVRETMAGFLFGDEGKQIRLTALRAKLKQLLNAKDEKVFNDKETGIVYSKKMVAHGPRLQAVKMCFELLDAFPAKTVRHEGEIEHTHKDQLSPELQTLFEKIIKRDQDSST